MRFWDASAIVPLLVHESPTDELVALLERDQTMLVWWGSIVECASALARRQRDGSLGFSDVGVALDRLRALADGWHEVLASNAVRDEALRALRVHPLRAADSLQLAAALVAAEHSPQTLEFVCLDARLCEAAAREGFPVIEPRSATRDSSSRRRS